MIILEAKATDMNDLAKVIRYSFATVAQQFGLTPENCPKHPSNCTVEWIEADMKRGVTYYLLEFEFNIIGCVALEKTTEKICYLERLAVVPDKRNQGFGQQLLNYFQSQAKSMGFTKIGIGIINKQHALKQWYKKLGFIETGTKTFEHLPFTVAFMEYHINE